MRIEILGFAAGEWISAVELQLPELSVPAALTPVCSLLPDHYLIEPARAAAESDATRVAWSYRTSMG